ncbi:MAG: RNase adapter RapZ [Acidobacteria bacterium]|nr:RNase adapter RapZ [Acidobacteriota bacterium]
MALEDLVIVTGMSGSGKGTVLKTFEDLGFFCIDNLPVPLMRKFLEVFNVSGGVFKRAALVIDIRAGEGLSDLVRMLAELRQSSFRLFVLYLEARDEVVVRRFSETRRPHPLINGGSLRDAIRRERRRLGKLKELADVTIDTSDLTVHKVKAMVAQKFRGRSAGSGLKVVVMSFGYKHGLPLEADLVFDARFLPNPFFVPRLRGSTGRDRRVKTFLRSFPETGEFVGRVGDLLGYLLPHYQREGKSQVTIAVGCTGGRHRSVFIAEELGKALRAPKRSLQVLHRDEGS